MTDLVINDCVVLHGPELEPHRCNRFAVTDGLITNITLGERCNRLDDGAVVIIPGLYNSHTHVGDSVAPDGTTGMTLEEGFFRPAGYKYRTLAAQSEATHLAAIVDHLRYMAGTGTIGHIDFREQGVYGAQLLRRASAASGVHSIILGQFDELPFTQQQLDKNEAELPLAAVEELMAVLDVADGFSESTMNDLTDAAWAQIADLAQHRNKLRAIHVLENDGYRSSSMAMSGRGDLARALDLLKPHLLIHATVANAAEIAMMSAHCCNVAINPRANANLGLPLPPIAALMQSNVNLLLGTDNGLLNSPNMFAELDYTYRLAKSQFGDARLPDPLAILKMATCNISKLLGPDIPGYLAEGLPADFVLLDFRAPHLKRSQHIAASIVSRVTPADVLATVRRGRVLWQANDALRQQGAGNLLTPA